MGNFFESIYSLVTKHEAWTNDAYGYYSNYFVSENAFMWAFISMLAIGSIAACIYYFGFCNGISNKYAKPSYWLITMAVVGILAFALGKLCFIGSDSSNDSGDSNASGFYKSCEVYCQVKVDENDGNEDIQNAIRESYNDIVENLNQGVDIVAKFQLVNLILSLLTFFIISMLVKNFTKHGSSIPFKLF